MKLFIAIGCFVCSVTVSVKAQSFESVVAGLQTDKQKADSIFSVARKVFRKAKFDSADYWLVSGYGFAKKTNDAEIMARYNVELANSQYMQGKYAKGLPFIYDAISLLKHVESYDLNNSALLIAGNCFNGLQKKDSALKYFFNCIDYNSKIFPYRNWLPYTAIGDVFLHTDNFAESEKYYQKAYDITAAKEGKPDHGYVLTMFANLYYVWQKPDGFAKMVEAYNQLMAARKTKDGKEPAHNLMMIQWQTDKLEDRVEFITKVKEASINNGARLSVYLTNSYLINLYEKNKQYEKALQFAIENETLAVNNKDIYNEYISNKVKYGLYKKTGNHTESEKTADKLFMLKDSLSNIQRRGIVMELESKYESDKKQKEIALLQAQGKLDAIAIANETEKRKTLFRENELKQAAIIEQQKNYVLLARQNVLMDSIVESEQAYNGLLLSENNLKQTQLAREQQLKNALSRENNLQTSQLIKEKQTRWLLTGGIALLLLSGFSIFTLYKKQKKKNILIQKQASDLEVLMKEIHHRVKNNLQVVSSLLDLQSHTITDSQASAAVKEGKNRVQSMALIHQNLYSEGNIKGIMVKEYISNLVQSLSDSYNITNDKVKVNINIDDLNLDVDTMIPLGLVLNELVSNSFKYAFSKQDSGILNIVLQEKNEKLYLKVSDNGAGFPADMDIKSAKSFGLKMIKAFAQKLKATLDIYNNDGAVVEMQISKFKAA
jgi:two-component sensor histidine kinase